MINNIADKNNVADKAVINKDDDNIIIDFIDSNDIINIDVIDTEAVIIDVM